MARNSSTEPGAIHASAPGKLIFMGEHAVLHGHRCLVAAVNRRLHLTLTPRADRRLRIRSELGDWEGCIDDLTSRPPFAFVLAALGVCAPLPGGCDITVHSEFGHTIGLGSSGAVTAATLVAVAAWQDACSAPSLDLLRRGRDAIRAAQGGSGSGADLAASLYGGALLYRADPLTVEPVSIPPAGIGITAVYCGYKTPTPAVIAQVESRRREHPAACDGLFRDFDALSASAAAALQAGDLPALGQAMDAGQAIMAALGLSDPTLDAIVAALRADPGIHGAKISGSGLGDCVLGIGCLAGKPLPWACPALDLACAGARVHASPETAEVDP